MFNTGPTMSFIEISLIIGAYLLGSISTAIIVCRLMQLPDPRTEGSGNPGATNVKRVGGTKPAVITLFFDMLKGFFPVLAAQLIGDISPTIIACVGLAAFLGHLWPVFFSFKGGKGVATMLGVLFGLHWALGLATAATWLIVAKLLKISSLSALIATSLAPLYSYFIYTESWGVTGIIIGMTVILFWRHRSNIKQLLSGKEDKIS